MTIVTDFLAILSALLTGFLGLVTDSFEGIVSIFYVAGEGGGFTIYGIFLLVALVMFFIMLAIHFITSLVRKSN